MKRVVGEIAHSRHMFVGYLEAGDEVGDRLVVELGELRRSRGTAAGQLRDDGAEGAALPVGARHLAGLDNRIGGGIDRDGRGERVGLIGPTPRAQRRERQHNEDDRTGKTPPASAAGARRQQRQGHCKLSSIPYRRGAATRGYRRDSAVFVGTPLPADREGAMARLKLGVLISGRGSNLQALIDAAADPAYPAEIALVVSNRREAAGLERAARAGVARRVIAAPDRAAFAAEADAALRQSGAQLVALAGFMRILDDAFVAAWRDRLVNIHPSLLPAFPGLHPQRQALAAGVRFSGCTVHFVRPEVDSGPIIAQAVVPVHASDDEALLSQRILAAEHRLYPAAVRLYAEGRLKIDGDRVTIRGAAPPEITLYNPSEVLAWADG